MATGATLVTVMVRVASVAPLWVSLARMVKVLTPRLVLDGVPVRVPLAATFSQAGPETFE